MSFRIKRLEHQFMQEIDGIIRKEVKDPRVEGTFITLTEVKIFDDYSQCQIFVSVLAENPYKAVEGLNHSAGYIRNALGKLIHIRKIPRLEFILDLRAQEADRMNRVLDQVKEKDGF